MCLIYFPFIDVFDDHFFENLDCVTNALDNVAAREYVDRRCIFYGKPLLESGTLGTKGNIQVVIPRLTESYSSSQDPPEKSIPSCTVRNFPSQIEHTINWALNYFNEYFCTIPESVNAFLEDHSGSYLDNLIKQGAGHVETIDNIHKYLVLEKTTTFASCVLWARLCYEEFFCNSIKQLLFNFPHDSITSSGQSFWSGTKRCPSPIPFDASNALALNFIIAAANLRAFTYGIPGCLNVEIVLELLKECVVEPFSPKEGLKIQTTENESINSEASGDEQHIKLLLKELTQKRKTFFKLNVAQFEKDDDTNFHISFIGASANLRALNYGIEGADSLKVKQIAGKIIPAIATTTSLVVGLVCLEMLKVKRYTCVFQY